MLDGILRNMQRILQEQQESDRGRGTLDLIGQRLRTERNKREWTLDALSARTGISPSTLSRLESGKRQATLDLLLPLTRCFGISLDELVRTEPADPRISPRSVRHGSRTIQHLSSPDSALQTFKITYAPTPNPPTLCTHEGREWLFVLSGKLLLRMGHKDLVLTRGQAADFGTTTPHSLSAFGPRPASIISIFNESGARIHTYGP